MRTRVLRQYEWYGAVPADVALLDACVSAALADRERRIGDEEDPRFLHPARSVLILLDDAGVRAADVLGGAALVESGDEALALNPETLTGLPAGAVVQAERVPLPGSAGDRLLEALLAAPTPTRLVACAERLDVTRHAHLLPGFDRAWWLEQAKAVYLPIAQRTQPRLALRFERWIQAHERRAAAE